MSLLKQIAAQLPSHIQTELKRLHFKRQLKRGLFTTDEPEYRELDKLLRPGDWVIDVGANVGHYTKRFSDIVGSQGRVLAFEPVPTTFSLLAANVQCFEYENVSLFNAAVSDEVQIVGISVPKFSTGLSNYYQAHLTASASCDLNILALPIDSIGIKNSISLVKIDAEGHEAFVINGMKQLIAACHPVLVVETGSQSTIDEIQSLGYEVTKMPNSPNVIFTPRGCA